MDDLISNARRKVVGTKQTIKALEKGEVLQIFIARDAEDRVVSPVLALCEAGNLEPQFVETMFQLGKMCGIKVRAAVAAIIEE